MELAPDDSTVAAINAFVLDWNASSNLVSADDREAYLAKAETSANRAYLLDPQNALALAFYAEVLLDQQKWDQAQQYARQAVELAPNSMDAHRVLATVLEGWGYYRDAIDEYIKASEITPNLTFLYLRIGLGYRQLAYRQTSCTQPPWSTSRKPPPSTSSWASRTPTRTSPSPRPTPSRVNSSSPHATPRKPWLSTPPIRIPTGSWG